MMIIVSKCLSFFFFNDTATTEIYTLSLHDALPIFLTLEATLALWEFRQESETYRRGWLDGYLQGDARNFSSSTQLVRWHGAHERLDYYRGHRAGSEERLLLLEQAASQVGSPSEKVRTLKARSEEHTSELQAR